MRVSKDIIRQIIREEIETVLNEAEGYNGPGSHIYDNVLEALDDAEEIWGVGDSKEDYLKLMRAVRNEIENRIQAVKNHM